MGNSVAEEAAFRRAAEAFSSAVEQRKAAVIELDSGAAPFVEEMRSYVAATLQDKVSEAYCLIGPDQMFRNAVEMVDSLEPEDFRPEFANEAGKYPEEVRDALVDFGVAVAWLWLHMQLDQERAAR